MTSDVWLWEGGEERSAEEERGVRGGRCGGGGLVRARVVVWVSLVVVPRMCPIDTRGCPGMESKCTELLAMTLWALPP